MWSTIKKGILYSLPILVAYSPLAADKGRLAISEVQPSKSHITETEETSGVKDIADLINKLDTTIKSKLAEIWQSDEASWSGCYSERIKVGGNRWHIVDLDQTNDKKGLLSCAFESEFNRRGYVAKGFYGLDEDRNGFEDGEGVVLIDRRLTRAEAREVINVARSLTSIHGDGLNQFSNHELLDYLIHMSVSFDERGILTKKGYDKANERYEKALKLACKHAGRMY